MQSGSEAKARSIPFCLTPTLITLPASSRIPIHGSRLTAHGSRLTAHGSRLTAHGSHRRGPNCRLGLHLTGRHNQPRPGRQPESLQLQQHRQRSGFEGYAGDTLGTAAINVNNDVAGAGGHTSQGTIRMEVENVNLNINAAGGRLNFSRWLIDNDGDSQRCPTMTLSAVQGAGVFQFGIPAADTTARNQWGKLVVNQHASGSIANTSTIDVQSGATFDVTSVSGFTVGGSQSLKGGGPFSLLPFPTHPSPIPNPSAANPAGNPAASPATPAVRCNNPPRPTTSKSTAWTARWFVRGVADRWRFSLPASPCILRIAKARRAGSWQIPAGS
jgi:hypothetical protein